ncbi:unnamed protein product [Anisakis simplex]|uniref:Max-interacting protein 1 n=1 Tax=Anisakis simplex TaxID=6269 RepID=A0A0M3JZZ6_ANISI|nr:unnamed protein product [Anisakis simplex]
MASVCSKRTTNLLEREIKRLESEIVEIRHKILELKKRKNSSEAKIALMRDHLQGSSKRSKNATTHDQGDSETESDSDSLNTSELLELSLRSSSLDSSSVSDDFESSEDEARGDEIRYHKSTDEVRLAMPE